MCKILIIHTSFLLLTFAPQLSNIAVTCSEYRCNFAARWSEVSLSYNQREKNVQNVEQPPDVFDIKNTVLKNFATFTEKDLCWSLFLLKFAVLPQACNFIKKRLQHRSFLVNIAKFLRTTILKNICDQLLLKM